MAFVGGASSSAGPIVPAGAFLRVPVITVYKYENSESPNFTNQLWVRGDTGLVMYVSKGGYTNWHGHFNRIGGHMASLSFDYDGDADNLKQVMLVGMERDSLSGVDYANRRITLTKIARYVWDMYTDVRH